MVRCRRSWSSSRRKWIPRAKQKWTKSTMGRGIIVRCRRIRGRGAFWGRRGIPLQIMRRSPGYRSLNNWACPSATHNTKITIPEKQPIVILLSCKNSKNPIRLQTNTLNNRRRRSLGRSRRRSRRARRSRPEACRIYRWDRNSTIRSAPKTPKQTRTLTRHAATKRMHHPRKDNSR